MERRKTKICFFFLRFFSLSLFCCPARRRSLPCVSGYKVNNLQLVNSLVYIDRGYKQGPHVRMFDWSIEAPRSVAAGWVGRQTEQQQSGPIVVYTRPTKTLYGLLFSSRFFPSFLCVKGLRAALIITMDVACYATLEPCCVCALAFRCAAATKTPGRRRSASMWERRF